MWGSGNAFQTGCGTSCPSRAKIKHSRRVVAVLWRLRAFVVAMILWRCGCGGVVVAASGKSESPLYTPQSIPQGGAGDSPTHFASESPGCPQRCLSNRCSGDTDLLEGAIGTHRRMQRRSTAGCTADAPQTHRKRNNRSGGAIIHLSPHRKPIRKVWQSALLSCCTCV